MQVFPALLGEGTSRTLFSDRSSIRGGQKAMVIRKAWSLLIVVVRFTRSNYSSRFIPEYSNRKSIVNVLLGKRKIVSKKPGL